MLGENATEVAGPAVGHASLIAALEKVRQVAQALVAVATGAGAEPYLARAQQLCDRGVGDGEAIDASVGLFDGDFQVTAVAAVVEVVDDERAGGDGGLVENGVALSDCDLGVGFRRAADCGAKPR